MKIPALEEITIGCDPEFFLKNEEGYIPAEVTGISGTKQEPLSLPSGGAVQIDGCALEFNIQPAKSADEFSQNIQATMKEIREIVDEKLIFDFKPVATFTNDVWDKTSKSSKELGCNPDYSAYTMEQKTPPQGSGDRPFRTAAGHIHVGFTKDMDINDPRHIYDCAILTQALDFYIGKFEQNWAPMSDRKKLYGEMGSFRPTPYGFEYRVLGNDWVDKPNVTKYLFERTRQVVHNVLTGNFAYPLTKDQIQPQNIFSFIHENRYPSILGKNYIKAGYHSGEIFNARDWQKNDVEYYFRNYY